MTSAQTEAESSSTGRLGVIGVVSWLGAGIAIAGVLALLVSHAPPRLRLIGLLAGVQGAACGLFVSLAGTRLKMRSPAVAVAGGFVFGLASVALTIGLWWKAHASQLKADYEPPKGSAIAMAMLNQAPEPVDAKTKKELDDYREALAAAGALPPDTSFAAYLEFRSSAISKSRTSSQILFCVELLFASVLCAGFARAGAARPFCKTCHEWILPIRKHQFTGEAAREIASLIGHEFAACVCASVELTQCRCEDRRPDVLVLLEPPDRKNAIRHSSSDVKSPLQLSDEAFRELTARIDAAQGLR